MARLQGTQHAHREMGFTDTRRPGEAEAGAIGPGARFGNLGVGIRAWRPRILVDDLLRHVARRFLTVGVRAKRVERAVRVLRRDERAAGADEIVSPEDRKSTRLNSSHLVISYAV